MSEQNLDELKGEATEAAAEETEAQETAEVESMEVEVADEADEADEAVTEALDAAIDDADEPATEAPDAAIDGADDANDAVAEALEPEPAEASAEDGQPAGAEKSEEAASTEKPAATGIGDLVIVGILAIILGVLLALPSALGLVGGESDASAASGGAAVTVNGVAVSEGEVTQYILNFRSRQGLEADDAWGEWLAGFGYTPESVRSDVIEYYIDRELMKQAIEEQGIEVAEADVDAQIATIAETFGGEEGLIEGLEQEGMTLESYREEILFQLQQQALAEKVAPEPAAIDDAQVLEIVKLYFPDAVDKDAKTLDGVDAETVSQVRSMLESSAVQQAFSDWMAQYRESAAIVIADMPEALPYAIDLTAYQDAASSADDDADGITVEEVEDDGTAEDESK